MSLLEILNKLPTLELENRLAMKIVSAAHSPDSSSDLTITVWKDFVTVTDYSNFGQPYYMNEEKARLILLGLIDKLSELEKIIYGIDS